MRRSTTAVRQAGRRAGGAPAWVATLGRAAVVAALVAVYADAPAEQGFGRLFFSDEERRTLDDRRTDWTGPEPTPQPTGERVPVAPVVDVISFDGKVERTGGGGATVWVNGQPVYTGNRTVEGIRIQSGRGTGAETRFVLPPSDLGETNFSLKVGQKIAVQSGKVLETYEVRAAEDAESVFADDEPPASDAAGENGEGGDDRADSPTSSATN